MIGRDVELALVREVCLGRRRGLALLGPSGIGRTALADAAESSAEASGITAFRVRATPAASNISFGALAHIMPSDSPSDGYALVRAFVGSLAERGAPRGGLLIVDDAHDLDSSSLAALHATAADRRTRVILTASTSSDLPVTLQRMWKDRLVDEHTVEPLEIAETRMLVEIEVGGSIDDVSSRTVWRLSRGRPMIAVTIAERCDWSRDGGAMTLSSDPTIEPALRRLVEPELAEIHGSALSVLSILDADEPVDVELVRAAFGDDVTDTLERSTAVVSSTRGELSASHPLVVAVALSSLTSRERRDAAERMATVIDDAGGLETLQGSQLARATRWRLDAGLLCAQENLLAVARSALTSGDTEAARDLASAVGADHPGFWEAMFIVGQAQRVLGDLKAAEIAFEQAMAAPTVSSRVDVAIARAELLSIACGRYGEATELLDRLAAEIGEPAVSARLLVERTLLASLAGDFRDVVSSATTALEFDLDDTSAILVASALGFARLMLLQLRALGNEVERSLRLADEHLAGFPLLADQFRMLSVAADQADGHIDRSIAVCVDARDANVLDAIGIGSGTWSAMEALGRSLGGTGGVSAAARRAAAALREQAPLGMRFTGTLFAATAAATSGDDLLAAELVEMAGPAQSDVEVHVADVILPRIEAWRVGRAGDFDRAADLLLTTGRRAVEMSHLYWGMFALHDAVRFGAASDALGLLESISAEPATECAWLEAAQQHARAEIDGDPDRLRTVAASFSAMGARTIAAEVVWRAASWCDRAGSPIEARRLRTCAHMMTDERTPLMTGGSPLTERQVEVARLAMGGGTSRTIASHLGVSIRTVENHLAAVYRRLEISGRSELEAIGSLHPTG